MTPRCEHVLENIPVASLPGGSADRAQGAPGGSTRSFGQAVRKDAQGGVGPPRANAQLMDVFRILFRFVQRQRQATPNHAEAHRQHMARRVGHRHRRLQFGDPFAVPHDD